MSEKPGIYEAQAIASMTEAERQRQQYKWKQSDWQKSTTEPHEFISGEWRWRCALCGNRGNHPIHIQRAESATDLVTPDFQEGGELARLRGIIREAHDALHAHNRPKLSGPLRLRVRDLLRQGLDPAPESSRLDPLPVATPDMGEGELEFVVCRVCEPIWFTSSPVEDLCERCRHNRAVIERLKQEQAKQARWLIGTSAYQGKRERKIRAQAFREAMDWCRSQQFDRGTAHFNKLAAEAEKG